MQNSSAFQFLAIDSIHESTTNPRLEGELDFLTEAEAAFTTPKPVKKANRDKKVKKPALVIKATKTRAKKVAA